MTPRSRPHCGRVASDPRIATRWRASERGLEGMHKGQTTFPGSSFKGRFENVRRRLVIASASSTFGSTRLRLRRPDFAFAPNSPWRVAVVPLPPVEKEGGRESRTSGLSSTRANSCHSRPALDRLSPSQREFLLRGIESMGLPRADAPAVGLKGPGTSTVPGNGRHGAHPPSPPSSVELRKCVCAISGRRG